MTKAVSKPVSNPLSQEAREALRKAFGSRVQFDVPLAPWSAARLGGPADALLEVPSVKDLGSTAMWLWEHDMPFRVLGGGSNVLIADEGVDGVVLLNRAREARFFEVKGQPAVWAASGASFGALARRAVAKGLDGLTWAIGIPGTVGGAVVGNAGAFGGDVATSLLWADVLFPNGRVVRLDARGLGLGYRTSALKTGWLSGVVLAAAFRLHPADPEKLKARVAEINEQRRRSQPPGASLGSIFKNPPGEYAGRLIEMAGLKGTRAGGVMISPQHANFFINLGNGTAMDYAHLMCLVRRTVWQRLGVLLEPEIQLIGRWPEDVLSCLFDPLPVEPPALLLGGVAPPPEE
ncbi:MAG: UDP-N-acetylmuramate dehydrogenase [Chloroflexi bacterium]|nr:UDP-N-acetylmuramate dehydrogenase [Chloroflexota bacterium]